jgi:hypothetical protein
MAYFGRKYAYYNTTSTPNKVTDPAVGQRLTTLLGNTSLNQKDREFVTSLDSTWKRFSNLSQRQFEYFEVVEKRYDPVIQAQNQAERAEWVKSWDAWKAKQLQICASYYNQSHYFQDLAKKALNEKDFIPTEKQFRAMCENKYAKRLIQNMTENAFEPGNVVQVRRRSDEPEVGTIVKVLDTITRSSANIGGRLYRVLWMNTGEETTVAEKELKKFRMKG